MMTIHDLAGRLCECGCDCGQLAVCTDDSSVPVCKECSDYAVDDDGEVHCARSSAVETVVESCGAGTATRSYVRMRPPAMPDADPAGEWACYWETACDGSHVVSRHATRREAEQAVAAHDWPPAGDHTHYLCGYVVRRLRDGRWEDE